MSLSPLSVIFYYLGFSPNRFITSRLKVVYVVVTKLSECDEKQDGREKRGEGERGMHICDSTVVDGDQDSITSRRGNLIERFADTRR